MSGIQPLTHESPPDDDERSAKRRKIRKGTRSCWECKRRKIRCTFAAPTNAVCDGCQRRGTSCVSQEFPDEPTAANQHVGDRLGRMEALVEQLVKKAGPGGLVGGGGSGADTRDRPSGSSPGMGIPTPESSEAETPYYRSWLGIETDRSLEAEALPTSATPIRLSVPARVLRPTAGGAGKYDELSRALLAEWPSEEDIDLLLTVETPDFSGFVHKIASTPYKQLMAEGVPSARSLLTLPPPGSHPVMIARSLLILATFIQGIPPSANAALAGLSVPYREIMRRAAEAAITLVNSNDEIMGSVEGVESIVIESMYQANAGNLRRAWLVVRRAMVLAQMMGMHRGVSSPGLKVIDLATRHRVDPAYMWFRIIFADRYLSLMLALPPGTLEDTFASPQEMRDCTDIERLERMYCVITGRILRRNDQGAFDDDTTREIDQMVAKASAVMPPQWWLPPRLASGEGNVFLETVRLIDQTFHYYLLIQTHLPYLMRGGGVGDGGDGDDGNDGNDRKWDYNKATVINASREVLIRATAFRSFNMTAFCCRGIDFFAFLASMALCIAHIQGHKQEAAGGFNCLAHQRPSDCGMMHRVLQSMDEMASLNGDALSIKSAEILRHMLAIESDSATGQSYSATSDKGHVPDCDRLGPGEKGILRICIPYFGTVKIARDGVSKADSAQPAAADGAADGEPAADHDPTAAAPAAADLYPDESSCLSTAGPAGYRVGGESVNADWQAIPSNFDDPVPPPQQPQPQPSLEMFDFLDDGNALQRQDNHVLVPGLTAGAEDWAFQGVDMAFFDSLMRGQVVPDAEPGWGRWLGGDSVM